MFSIGEDPFKRVTKVVASKGKGKVPLGGQEEQLSSDSESADNDDDSHWDKIRSHFRIYFPSRRTVAESRGGIGVS